MTDGPAPLAALAHYRLLEKIGSGGMSEVWRALDTRLDREVALKLLPPGSAEDAGRLALFKSEARAVAALNHPHIVTLYAIEEAEGRTFMTMELIRGHTLKDLIPENGLALAAFFNLAMPLADAVSAAHARGVIHGDLKPANVMVNEAGTLKVLDFGLARFDRPSAPPAKDETSTLQLELDGRLAGTLLYMSPEHIQGRPLDARSDIFALGVVFYEMLTGRLPFRGASVPELMASILKDEPPPLAGRRPDLPRDLGRIIGRCLEKEPDRRLQTSLDLRNELDALRRQPAPGPAEGPISIAVLPFSDLSAAKDQEYFCEGIAEEIINTLSSVRGLKVAARTSSFKFKNAVLDGREIGAQLGVCTLLGGSVRKAGRRLRISVELTDVASGDRLWAEQFDRELKAVFAIQEEIAQAVVNALEITLSPRERRALKQVATADAQAYDFYLRGRNFFYQARRRGLTFALQMFSRAIEFDPNYALAYAGIADCHAFMFLNFERAEIHRREADAASLKALELDPELAEAYVARGVALSVNERMSEAEKAFETALRINPRLFDACYYYARHRFQQGQPELALPLYEQASRLRPDDYQSPLLVAQIFDDLGRPEEARARRQRGVKLVEERLDLVPDDVRALYMGANGLVALGEREKGLAWARRARDIEPDEPMLLYNLACIYSLAGETETALDCLENAVALGLSHRRWIENDSNLDAVRGSPRYAAVLRSIS